jgi:hypothetical protein
MARDPDAYEPAAVIAPVKTWHESIDSPPHRQRAGRP